MLLCALASVLTDTSDIVRRAREEAARDVHIKRARMQPSAVPWVSGGRSVVRARARATRAAVSQSSRGGRPSQREPRCGSVSAIAELDAPIFMADEKARRLIAESAPFGLKMGGDPEEVMLRKLRRYHRNTSVPLKCQYATCAVVGSSGSLRGGQLGEAIDAHEAVIRINAAPVHGHEEAVGVRTTWRVHNSEKPFMLAATDDPALQLLICHMAWIGSCQHQAYSGAYTRTTAYINPVFYSQLWSVLGRPKDKRSPSTGLLAIAIALGACGRVSIYGFGHAGKSSNCRHYWECVHFEDER
mgnify:CR=1 FL=1|jgi:hypothetical protein